MHKSIVTEFDTHSRQTRNGRERSQAHRAPVADAVLARWRPDGPGGDRAGVPSHRCCSVWAGVTVSAARLGRCKSGGRLAEESGRHGRRGRLRGSARGVQQKAEGQNGFGKRRTGQDPAQTTVTRTLMLAQGWLRGQGQKVQRRNRLTYGH